MTSNRHTAGQTKGVAGRKRNSRHLRRAVTFQTADAFVRLGQMVLDDPAKLRQMPAIYGPLLEQGAACVSGLEAELGDEDPELDLPGFRVTGLRGPVQARAPPVPPVPTTIEKPKLKHSQRG